MNHGYARGIEARRTARGEFVAFARTAVGHDARCPRADVAATVRAHEAHAGHRRHARRCTAVHRGDQPLFGHRVHQVGAGPEPILRAKLSVERLARSIEDLLGNHACGRAASAIGETLARENGAERAATLVEQHVTARR